MDLPQFDLSDFVRRVLAEDMGSGGDITSNATIAPDARFSAVMTCREPISVAGIDIAAAFFRVLDREVRIDRTVGDGDHVPAGTVLMTLDGNARLMLAAERSALNTLQHLSGIATPDAQLCRCNRGNRRDPARHAQNHPWAAPARQVCGADGGRPESPYAPG